MSDIPSDVEVADVVATLRGVPRLPEYARQCLEHLIAEVDRARREEQRLREAMDDVKRAVQEVET